MCRLRMMRWSKGLLCIEQQLECHLEIYFRFIYERLLYDRTDDACSELDLQSQMKFRDRIVDFSTTLCHG